jgi:hypothetical protein
MKRMPELSALRSSVHSLLGGWHGFCTWFAFRFRFNHLPRPWREASTCGRLTTGFSVIS